MSIKDKALAIIKDFEGFRADAYPDPRTGDEPWTIGYGTTWLSDGRKVKKGDRITEFYANEQLLIKVANIHYELRKEIKVPLTDGQWACMISFVYNLGMNGASLQIARLNAGFIDEFKRKHLEYINKGTNVEAGLLRRRKAELALFIEGETMERVILVRHGSKAETEMRAYVMNGDVCVALKRFSSTAELAAILQKNKDASLSIGEYGWHSEPVKHTNPLDVPYFSQRNYGGSQSWSICGCTSVAMVLAYYGISATPDTVLRGYGKASCQSPVGCETVFESNKLKANSTYNGTWKQIRDEIDLGRPVVIHGRFTASGHIIVVIGYDELGYYCNDPAGKWEQKNDDSYSDNPKNGAGVYYREEAMWLACGKDREVWYSTAFR
jgi:lysozyme